MADYVTRKRSHAKRRKQTRLRLSQHRQRKHGNGRLPLAGARRQQQRTGTIEAYERLLEGKTDIIFCAAPSKDQLALAENMGMELHLMERIHR